LATVKRIRSKWKRREWGSFCDVLVAGTAPIYEQAR
jgi:hypothetical protein